MIKKPYNY